MAIVKYGVLVTGIRGKLQGSVFSANHSANYVRPWYRSANPRTSAQSKNRGLFGQLPFGWRGLTDAQRADWDTWAALPAQAKINALGETYYCSGWNWYATINQRLTYAGEAFRDTYPTDARPAAPTITAFTFTESGGSPQARITWAGAEFAVTEAIIIAASANPGAGRQVQYGSYPVLKAVYDPGASPEDFSAEYVARFGTPQEGSRGFVRVYKQSEQGLRSAPWSTFTDYTVP